MTNSFTNLLCSSVIFKPCKKCGSLDYDQAEYDEMEVDEDGNSIAEPVKCDVCDISLISTSELPN